MGPYGRGNWVRSNRKVAVEESLTLGVADFGRKLLTPSSGRILMTRLDGVRSSMEFIIDWDESPTLRFFYRWGDDIVHTTVGLVETATQFGGTRWWFSCPFVTDEAVCGKRVAKLHLPPGAKHFGCRNCHRLTYQSCREAHKLQREFAGPKRLQKRLEKLIRRER